VKSVFKPQQIAACSAVSGLLFNGLAALAAEDPEPLGASIVTATRTVTEIDEVLAPVIVITREDLERSLAPDIASLLRFHAGIDIGRNGGPGQVTSVFIRGTDSNHATVLIDGVRINPGTIGGAQIQNIVPESIERIEIVKGPRSTLYGTDAIGGVINIITRGHSRNTLSASVGGGRYDTRQATLAASFGGAQGDAAVSGAWLDSDGFPTRTTSDTDRGYENSSITAKARVHLGPLELGVRGWRAAGTTEYSDFFLAPVDQDYENSALAAEAAVRPTERWLTRLTLSHIEDDIQQNQSEDRTRTRRDALDWQNDIRIGERNVLTFGTLLTREDTDSLEFGTGFDVGTDVDMVFLQDRLDFGRHNLLLAVATLDHETFGSETTWNADYGLDIGSATRVVASVGTAFRAPDSTDRFGFGGNPDLDPERSRNFELGLQHRLGTRHQLGLSVFRNDVDDLIEFVVLDPNTFEGENRNVEEARIEGAELSYEYRGESWRLRTEAIVQNPRDLTQDSRLLRRAEESLTLSVVKTVRHFEFGVDALATGDREDFGFPEPTTLDSYTLLNLTGRWFITTAWSVQARVENALDDQYILANGFNTADRSLFFAARYEFR
jgi:vitamin B12 transporter